MGVSKFVKSKFYSSVTFYGYPIIEKCTDPEFWQNFPTTLSYSDFLAFIPDGSRKSVKVWIWTIFNIQLNDFYKILSLFWAQLSFSNESSFFWTKKNFKWEEIAYRVHVEVHRGIFYTRVVPWGMPGQANTWHSGKLLGFFGSSRVIWPIWLYSCCLLQGNEFHWDSSNDLQKQGTWPRHTWKWATTLLFRYVSYQKSV